MSLSANGCSRFPTSTRPRSSTSMTERGRTRATTAQTVTCELVTRPAFATTIFDVDSTISGIEGVDWLAARRSGDIAREVAAVTDKAMRGEIALEQVYGRRLDLVRPTRGDVNALGRAYVDAIAPRARDVIQALLAAGV